MGDTHIDAAGERIAGPGRAPDVPAPPGRRLIDGQAAARKAGISYRHWLRLCDAGRAPWGVKLGAARRWDEAQIEAWICTGCPSIKRTNHSK